MKMPDRHAIWRWTKQSFHGLLVFLGGIYLVSLVLIAAWALRSGVDVPDHALLELDLERAYPESVPPDPVSRATAEDGPTVREIVDAVRRAAGDDRVVGLVARVGTSGMGLARIQEIRDAVLAFRESGKPAVAWAETFGEAGPANGAYYLASAFDEIRLQPSGDVALTGLRVETPFLAEGLGKLGIRMVGDRRYEYKNAYNTLVDTAYTAAHEEATSAVMWSQFQQIARGIEEGRGLDSAAVADVFERGLFFGPEAVAAGLVDGLAYRDEVYEELSDRLGPDAEPLYLSRYAGAGDGDGDPAATVALVQGVGPVVRGSGESGPFSSPVIASRDVTAAFRAALEDEDVDAILFRVDSPGGSYVASDAIWRAVGQAREKGKPVVVSMGDVAGSGGYFVAMAADRIVAQPGTITGSIGVLSLKPVTAELWEKLGIDWDHVQTSPKAEMWSSLEGFDPDEWELVEAELDRTYRDFTEKAAQGRGLPLDSVRRIARGRIWTGEQAARLGLVDEVGGYPAAYAALRRALELPEDAPLRLRRFPRPRSWWDELVGREPSSSRGEALRTVAGRIRAVGAVADELARSLGLARTRALRMPATPPSP